MTAVVPIVDIGTVKLSGWKELDGQADDVITRYIDAATADIESRIKPRLIVSRDYTLEPYDGDATKGRWGERLYLDQYPVTVLTTVKENGLTLVTGTGYDAAGTRDALLYATDGILVRKSGRIQRAWAEGLQNVEVTYTAGFADPVTECADLAAICIKLAVLHYKAARRAGQSSTRRPTSETSFLHQLEEWEIGVIDRYAPWGRPRCRA